MPAACFVAVRGSWVGVRRLFHRSLFLTASRVVLPQGPSTTRESRLTLCRVLLRAAGRTRVDDVGQCEGARDQCQHHARRRKAKARA